MMKTMVHVFLWSDIKFIFLLAQLPQFKDDNLCTWIIEEIVRSEIKPFKLLPFLSVTLTELFLLLLYLIPRFKAEGQDIKKHMHIWSLNWLTPFSPPGLFPTGMLP